MPFLLPAVRQHAPLCRLPLDVLQSIALELTLTRPLGLLDDLLALLQTCQHLHALLAPAHNNHLYARVFRTRYDTRAAARHLSGAALYSTPLAAQLRVYCAALKRIRAGDPAAPGLEHALWTAALMLLENDGRNYAQLTWAGLPRLVDRFVRERLRDGAAAHRGWPADSALNALALYLLWCTTDSETLQTETAEARRELLEITRPYVMAPFKYAPFHAPDCYFQLPLASGSLDAPPALLATPHGPYPAYPHSRLLVERTHCGVQLVLRAPPVAIYASLLYFSRLEHVDASVPDTVPADRAAALAQGIVGVHATQDDYRKFHTHRAAVVVPKGSWDLSDDEPPPSLAWDNDWNRLRFCANPFAADAPRRTAYTFGTLTGKWAGRMMMHGPRDYLDSVRRPEYVAGRPLMWTLPISFRLREHHCIAPHTAVPCASQVLDGRHRDDGILNAWFPPGTSFSEHDGVLTITTARDGRVYTYATHRRGRAGTHDARTCAACRARGAHPAAGTTMHDFPPAGLAQDVTSEEEVVPAALGAADLEDMLRVAAAEAAALYGPLGGGAGAGAACEGGVTDVVLTGESLPQHSEAWHRWRYYGRVRAWDGLVALVRVPVQLDLGVSIFRGYVVAGRSFVGTWRAWNRPERLPSEGPFIAGRAPEAD